MAKSIELTGDQQEILSDVLKSTLGDMSYEIADTDNSEYKEQLKKRRDALKAVLELITD